MEPMIIDVCGLQFRLTEEPVELIVVDDVSLSIECLLDMMRSRILKYGKVSLYSILGKIALDRRRIPLCCKNYIIDNIDEFDSTFIEHKQYGYISHEYVASIQGIKRAP